MKPAGEPTATMVTSCHHLDQSFSVSSDPLWEGPSKHLRKSAFAGRPRRGSLCRIQPGPYSKCYAHLLREVQDLKRLLRFRGSQDLRQCHGPLIGHRNESPTPTHQRDRVLPEGCRNQSPDRPRGRGSPPCISQSDTFKISSGITLIASIIGHRTDRSLLKTTSRNATSAPPLSLAKSVSALHRMRAPRPVAR